MWRLAILLVIALPRLAGATTCESLAQAAERRHALPQGLLVAIARTESSGHPWTLNINGQPARLASRDAAEARLRAALQGGVRNIDIGCMQVNWRWHGDAFERPEALLDPARNIEYAARHLAELFAQTGDWASATRQYHSADPERGAAFLQRVNRNHPGEAGTEPAPSPATAATAALAALMARAGPSPLPQWGGPGLPRRLPEDPVPRLRRILSEMP